MLLRRGGSKGRFVGVLRPKDLKQGPHMWLDSERYLMAREVIRNKTEQNLPQKMEQSHI